MERQTAQRNWQRRFMHRACKRTSASAMRDGTTAGCGASVPRATSCSRVSTGRDGLARAMHCSMTPPTSARKRVETAAVSAAWTSPAADNPATAASTDGGDEDASPPKPTASGRVASNATRGSSNECGTPGMRAAGDDADAEEDEGAAGEDAGRVAPVLDGSGVAPPPPAPLPPGGPPSTPPARACPPSTPPPGIAPSKAPMPAIPSDTYGPSAPRGAPSTSTAWVTRDHTYMSRPVRRPLWLVPAPTSSITSSDSLQPQRARAGNSKQVEATAQRAKRCCSHGARGARRLTAQSRE